MCQKNNIQKRFTAGTICYKVLYNSFVKGYLSMYQRTSWKLGQIRKTGFYKLSLSQIEQYYHSFDNIDFGFFHAFPTLEEAIRFQSIISESFFSPPFRHLISRFPIAEMRIPEDVNGFSGTYFDYAEVFDSIAVPILEFVKIVDQNVSIQ